MTSDMEPLRLPCHMEAILEAAGSKHERRPERRGWKRPRFPILPKREMNWKKDTMASALTDLFGRRLDYLRISVTDRCHFRCLYCLPAEGISLLPKAEILSRDEIVRVARVFLGMGGKKIKLTGGEPLARPDIVEIVRDLAPLKGLQDLGMTTNGYRLKNLAGPLFETGLRRVNVSLDSLNPLRFARVTGSGDFENVKAGILEALRVGFRVKINVVALKGLGAHDLEAFGTLLRQHPLEIRFIEFMPLCGAGWHPEWRLPLENIEGFFREHFSLLPLHRGKATSRTFRVEGGPGKIGFIASLTEPFCARCSRLRLTADGQLRPCLFSNQTIDLKTVLRNGGGDDAIRERIRKAVMQKPEGHGITTAVQTGAELPRIRAFGG